MISTIRFLLGTVVKMLPMISADMAKWKVVTIQMVIEVLEMQGANISTQMILCQQFTSASMIHWFSLQPLCSMITTANIVLEGFMLPLNMVSPMIIIKDPRVNLNTQVKLIHRPK